MRDASPDNGQLACDQIWERRGALFPEMRFKVLPQNGTRAFRIPPPGTIRIFGQRTRNMRYDRGNFYASCDVSGEACIAADIKSGTDALLQSAVGGP